MNLALFFSKLQRWSSHLLTFEPKLVSLNLLASIFMTLNNTTKRQSNPMIRYKQYTITKHDDRNWVLRFERDGLDKDKKPKLFADFRGYYGSVGAALSAIVKFELGEGCEDIQGIISQINTLTKELTKIKNEH